MEMQPLLVREVIFQCPPAENTYISAQARQGIEKIRNKGKEEGSRNGIFTLHHFVGFMWDIVITMWDYPTSFWFHFELYI